MKVKLKISRAGLSFVQNVGDVVEVSDSEGKALIESGRAEPVAEKRKVQKATNSPKETR